MMMASDARCKMTLTGRRHWQALARSLTRQPADTPPLTVVAIAAVDAAAAVVVADECDALDISSPVEPRSATAAVAGSFAHRASFAQRSLATRSLHLAHARLKRTLVTCARARAVAHVDGRLLLNNVRAHIAAAAPLVIFCQVQRSGDCKR